MKIEFPENPWQMPNHYEDGIMKLVDPELQHKFYWFISPAGNYGILCEFNLAIREDLYHKESRYYQVQVSRRQNKLGSDLIIELKNNDYADVFKILCQDLILSCEHVHSQAVPQQVMDKMNQWEEFFNRKNQKYLSEKQQMGLYAELLFFKDIATQYFSPKIAMESWNGHERSLQDFIINDTAVEIKAKGARSKPTVKISSAEQLYTDLSSLYLRVYTIKRTNPDQKTTLYGLVEEILSYLNSDNSELAIIFNNALSNIRYLHVPEYDKVPLQVESIQTFSVHSDFPRFDRTVLPNGISNVKYNLDLAFCDKFVIDEQSFISQMEELDE